MAIQKKEKSSNDRLEVQWSEHHSKLPRSLRGSPHEVARGVFGGAGVPDVAQPLVEHGVVGRGRQHGAKGGLEIRPSGHRGVGPPLRVNDGREAAFRRGLGPPAGL